MATMHDNTDLPADATAVRLRVRYAETDAGGVVYHSRYLPWLEMGRTEWMRARGYTYRQLEQMGLFLMVIEVHLYYRAPSTYDDPIVLHARLAEFGRVKVRFAYQVYNEETGRLLAEGETLHAFVGRDGRPIRLASQFPEVWARLQAVVRTTPGPDSEGDGNDGTTGAGRPAGDSRDGAPGGPGADFL
ncbi:MAG TPA: thioesterase family protein [Chloroflexia bacterium]|nr:thioesterase family protein [Chloroflexia bacterium]